MARFEAVDRWQSVTGKNDAETAELINVSPSKFSRFVNGLMALPMADQLTLERITGISPAQCAEFYAEAVKERARGVKKNFEADRALIEPEGAC